MLEELVKNFLYSYSEEDGLSLLRVCRFHEMLHLGNFLGKFLEFEFPHSSKIKDELGIQAYMIKDYKTAFKTYNRLLDLRGLSEEFAFQVMFNQHFSIDHVANNYIYYNENKVTKILNRKKREIPKITFTITSCKRFDLFEQTINSFINCCKDIDEIDYWLCVDDNSSEEDREKMSKLYPFFEFYFKNPEEKGHPQSMNIIRNNVKTPYIFHMEDDWKFFNKQNYITNALDVLGQDDNIKQCLINKNYSETEKDVSIKGGEFRKTDKGLRFFVHEFVRTEEERVRWMIKHGNNGYNCNYWPHFSFRPSLFYKYILDELGEFNQNISHFEMDYSYRYANRGYKSAFFEAIYCLHIGRLTSERHTSKDNAYTLNNEAQFSGKEEQYKENEDSEDLNFDISVKTVVINLDRRPDRWEEFNKKASEQLSWLKYERFSAIDGSKLVPTEQLQRIFENNDYNMRSGMVGCAMSHIKLLIELVNNEEYDAYCILEDDLDFVPRFRKKLIHVYNQAKIMNWDMIYLGHHLYKEYITEEVYDKIKMPRVEKWDRITSLTKSMGGTGGYLISKNGARKLLDFINRTGMTNGIDTVQQKAADDLNIFYTYPHLIYSECYRGDNNLDTDIQYNYDSLTIPVSERLEEEKRFYSNMIKIDNYLDAMNMSVNEEETIPFYYQDEDIMHICSIIKQSEHQCYTLDNKTIIVVPKGNPERYFARLMKNGNFDINDALIFKE